MRLPLLALLAVSAHACLWDEKDERLFCGFTEIQPTWAIRCNPPTPEPARSDTGTVYCGEKTLGSSSELNLDCNVIKAAENFRSTDGTSSMKLKCAVVPMSKMETVK